MKRITSIVVGLVLLGLLGAAGYFHLMHARQMALGKAIEKLNASGSPHISPADLEKIETLSGFGVKLTTRDELAIAGAYAQTGNDDKALDWYKRAANDSQNQSLSAMVESQEALAHFYSVKTDPDIQECGNRYEALRSSLIADGSPAAQSSLAEVDMMHAEDLISYVRGFYSRISFMQASADLTQSNDLLWRALSRCKSVQMPKDKKSYLMNRIQADQQLLSKLVQ